MKLTKAIKLFLNLYAVLFFLGPIIHSLKIIRLSVEVGAYTFYISTVIYFLLNVIHAITIHRDISKMPVFFIDFLLMSIFGVGLLGTFVFQGDYVDISGNFLRVVTSILIFWNFRIIFQDRNFNEYLSNEYIKRIAKYGFIGVLVALFVVYLTIFSGTGVYLGLSTENIVPFIGQNIHFAPLKMILGISMTVLGGKRGVILGVLIGCIYILFFKRDKLRNGKIFISLLFLLLPIFLIIVSVQSDNVYNDLPRSIQRRVEPFRLGESSSEGIDIARATSGRNWEVEAVFNQWKEEPITAWIGKGFGATFKLEYSEEEDSSVHISPIGVSFLVGLPLGLFFYIVLFYFIFKYRKPSKGKQVWFFIFLFTIVNSFTVFSIFQTPIFWISFAALITKTNENTNILSKKAL